MISVGIVGGTGYTGVELLRCLAQHPYAQVSIITSRSEAGTPVSGLYPSLRHHYDLSFSEPDMGALDKCDIVFFATPHGVAQSMAPELLETGTRVIDLSADFRLKDVDRWASWYGQAHNSPHWVQKAVYGLPEVNRETIRDAQLVACPGCYPTAVQLGFLPLLKNNIIDPERLIANAASGISGAGRQAKLGNLLAEAGENFRAYGVSGHRHLPEIEQGLALMTTGAVPRVTFVPHLLPTIRGIHATLYATLSDKASDLQALFASAYADEPFVDVLPAGVTPDIKSVRATNMCRIAVARPQNRETVVVMSVIDNLAKGASTQAIQNMNLMLGFDETTGLTGLATVP